MCDRIYVFAIKLVVNLVVVAIIISIYLLGGWHHTKVIYAQQDPTFLNPFGLVLPAACKTDPIMAKTCRSIAMKFVGDVRLRGMNQ